MHPSIITNKPDYPIKPEHINVTNNFRNTFADEQTEISAHYIVRFCQKLGGWTPFARKDIENFYIEATQHKNKNFSFNKLINCDYIIKEAGKLHVTHKFVALCFTASPAI